MSFKLNCEDEKLLLDEDDRKFRPQFRVEFSIYRLATFS